MLIPDERMSGTISFAEGLDVEALPPPIALPVAMREDASTGIVRGVWHQENHYRPWLDNHRGALPIAALMHLYRETRMAQIAEDEAVLDSLPQRRHLPRSHFRPLAEIAEDQQAAGLEILFARLGKELLEKKEAMDRLELEAHRTAVDVYGGALALAGSPTIVLDHVAGPPSIEQLRLSVADPVVEPGKGNAKQ